MSDSVRPRSPGAGAQVAGRLAIGAVYLTVLLRALGPHFTRFENLAAGKLLVALGEHRISAQATVMLIWPVRGLNFLLVVTWACSSVPILAGLGVVALMLSTAPLGRRLSALAVASAGVVAVNVLRLASSAWAAAHWGQTGLLVWHDWVGTAVTLVTGAAAVWLCLHLAGRHPAVANGLI